MKREGTYDMTNWITPQIHRLSASSNAAGKAVNVAYSEGAYRHYGMNYGCASVKIYYANQENPS